MSVPNVLANRYASEAMRTVWSPENKIIAERRLWIAVLSAQRDLGVDFGGDDPDVVIEAYAARSVATCSWNRARVSGSRTRTKSHGWLLPTDGASAASAIRPSTRPAGTGSERKRRTSRRQRNVPR